jgi:hypothetical protein
LQGNNEEISTAGVDIRAEGAEYEYLFKHSGEFMGIYQRGKTWCERNRDSSPTI